MCVYPPGLCHLTVEESPTKLLGCQDLGVLGCRLGGADGPIHGATREDKGQFGGWQQRMGGGGQ